MLLVLLLLLVVLLTLESNNKYRVEWYIVRKENCRRKFGRRASASSKGKLVAL